MSRSERGSAGFTLLEVMVAISILALSLVAISGINVNSFAASNYARGITVATLLARSKMIDIELELEKDGFPTNDRVEDGDFSDEGYPKVRWVASIREIKVDLSRFLAQMMGGDKELDTDQLPENMAAMVGAMRGESASEVDSASSDELRQLMGGGALEAAMKQAADTLSKSIREVSLEISWGEPNSEESIRFVQYLTTSGRIKLAPTPTQRKNAKPVTKGGRGLNSALPTILKSGGLGGLRGK